MNKKPEPVIFDDMVKNFATRIGKTPYRMPIDDILEAFRQAMLRELDVDITIIQNEPRREH
uniref:Uncharacterized protein n=1 Tax=viral metagenome TaxID=1070528 RepID=A0A6H1ZHF0_9ZZZZ